MWFSKLIDDHQESICLVRFAEALQGVATVRAFNMSESVIQSHEKLVDVNNKLFYVLWMAQRWLALRVDLVAMMLQW